MIIDDTLLDELIAKAKESPRLRMNYDLRNTPDDKSQRMMNALIPGTKIPIHRHTKSSETLFVLRGKMDEIFYDDNGNETGRVHLNPTTGCYGVDISMNVWHTIEAFEPTVIMESKDGPYEPQKAEDILNK